LSRFTDKPTSRRADSNCQLLLITSCLVAILGRSIGYRYVAYEGEYSAAVASPVLLRTDPYQPCCSTSKELSFSSLACSVLHRVALLVVSEWGQSRWRIRLTPELRVERDMGIVTTCPSSNSNPQHTPLVKHTFHSPRCIRTGRRPGALAQPAPGPNEVNEHRFSRAASSQPQLSCGKGSSGTRCGL
jgi:hypothetical protein